MAKKHGQPEEKPRRLSKEESIACETERDHAHMESSQITSALIVIACEQSELEKEILRMSVQIAGARQRQRILEAKRSGLNKILNKRNDVC